MYNYRKWDERYGAADFAYGTEPNGFLSAEKGRIPDGRVLSLAEGEGRNGVFLAGLGFDVTGVDGSSVGLAKAQSLAQDAGVTLTTVVTALEDFTIEPETWQGIVSIFCHLPPPLRSRLHREAVAGLVPGGVFILEAYTPRQLGRGTGGPPIPELLMPLDEVRTELDGLDLVIAREIERDVVEGRFHTGTAHVLQIVGVK